LAGAVPANGSILASGANGQVQWQSFFSEVAGNAAVLLGFSGKRFT